MMPRLGTKDAKTIKKKLCKKNVLHVEVQYRYEVKLVFLEYRNSSVPKLENQIT